MSIEDQSEAALNDMKTITMSLGELDRLKVIQALVDGGMKPRHAAQRLGLTTRQVRRLVERYRAQGDAGLISQKRNRPSNNQIDPVVVQIFSEERKAA
jgi:transposase